MAYEIKVAGADDCTGGVFDAVTDRLYLRANDALYEVDARGKTSRKLVELRGSALVPGWFSSSSGVLHLEGSAVPSGMSRIRVR